MSILTWIVLGGLAGWVASMIMGTNGSMGLIANIFVGILGALIGGWVFSLFGEGGVSGFNWWSFFVALVGSCILLLGVKLFQK